VALAVEAAAAAAGDEDLPVVVALAAEDEAMVVVVVALAAVAVVEGTLSRSKTMESPAAHEQKRSDLFVFQWHIEQ
jgi:hypothetical protein